MPIQRLGRRGCLAVALLTPVLAARTGWATVQVELRPISTSSPNHTISPDGKTITVPALTSVTMGIYLITTLDGSDQLQNGVGQFGISVYDFNETYAGGIPYPSNQWVGDFVGSLIDPLPAAFNVRSYNNGNGKLAHVPDGSGNADVYLLGAVQAGPSVGGIQQQRGWGVGTQAGDVVETRLGTVTFKSFASLPGPQTSQINIFYPTPDGRFGASQIRPIGDGTPLGDPLPIVVGAPLNVHFVADLATPAPAATPVHGFLTGAIDPGKATTVVITHGWEPGQAVATPAWATQMKNSISGVSPGVNAVTWTWADAFTPSTAAVGLTDGEYERARAEAQYQGTLLYQSLVQQNVQQVHLVGEGLGAWVNAYATRLLLDKGISVVQETVLDRAEGQSAVSGYEAALFQHSFFTQAGGGVGWVDNYYGQPAPAATGAPLPFGYNQFVNADHDGVHNYYQGTIGGTSEGFYWSLEGGGAANRPAQNPSTALLGNGPAANFGADGWLISTGSTISGNTATLQEHSPAYLWTDLTLPADATFLAFDLKWDNIGDGDYLTVYFGSHLLFITDPSAQPGPGFFNTGPIDVADFAGQTGQLLFTLNSVGAANAQLEVSNLTFSTGIPEPASLTVVAAGAAILIVRRRKDRDRARRAD